MLNIFFPGLHSEACSSLSEAQHPLPGSQLDVQGKAAEEESHRDVLHHTLHIL